MAITNVYGNESKDGYFYGYVKKFDRWMQFPTRDYYIEYLEDLEGNEEEEE